MPASAPTYSNFSTVVDPVTTQQFMRGEFDNTKKRIIVLNRLDERGKIKPDASGTFAQRQARVGQHQSAARADLAERTFAKKQQRVNYTFPWAWYETTGALGDQDIVYNSGKEALVRLKEVMYQNMAEDFTKDLNKYLLQNNAGAYTAFGQSAASNLPVPIYGLPTIFGYGSAAQQYSTGDGVSIGTTSGAVGAGDKEVLPNTTYCGISTHPFNAISGVDGRAYESTSPVICNWSSTAWAGAGNITWDKTCVYVLDYMQARLARSSDPADSPDMFLMTRQMFNDLGKAIIGGAGGLGARILLGKDPVTPNMKAFGGNGNRIPFDNMDGYWDVYVPASTLYMLNTNHMEFCYHPVAPIKLGADLQTDGADMSEIFFARTAYDIKQGGHLAVAALSAQLWANPYFQGAAYAFA